MEFSVDSGPFIGRFSMNAEGIARDHMSFRFSISGPIPEIFAIKVRSGRKSPEIFACFWPHFFGGGVPPEFLDLIYLIPPVSDHVAKFHGDRSRDGGEKLAKEIKKRNKKNITSIL